MQYKKQKGKNRMEPHPGKSSKSWFSRIKSFALYVFLAIALGWGVDFWRAQSIASGTAPALVADSLQGEHIDLIKMSQDKPVLVYFWATWCSVCRFVSPSVNFVDSHMQVVTVALNSGEGQRVEQYLNAKGYEFTVLNDPKGIIGHQWGITLTPTILIIDKGKITSVTTGFTSPIGMWLRMLLS